MKAMVFGIRIALVLFLIIMPLPVEAVNIAPSQGVFSQTNVPSQTISEVQKQTIRANFAKVKVPWIENQGQVDKQVAFYAKLSNGTVYLTKIGEMVHQYLIQPSMSLKNVNANRRAGLNLPYGQGVDSQSNPPDREIVFKKHLKNTQKLSFQGETPSVTSINYFIGNNEKDWKTNLKTYETIGAKEVYPKIDLSYQPKMGLIEEIFTVNPGGKVQDIEVEVEGVKGITVDGAGDLVIATETGDFKQTKPVAYQMIDGKRIDRTAVFKIIRDGFLPGEPSLPSYGFQVADYNSQYPLIIDPLIYSTFVGGDRNNYGGGSNYGFAIALDAAGNAYVTGFTSSTNFPTTTGAYDESFNETAAGLFYYDIFVLKLNANGNGLIYSTYVGGNGYDYGFAIALDAAGNAYVTGKTGSQNFPTTTGAYDATYNGGPHDIFVLKLNANGNGLIYSTYVGGDGNEQGTAMALDAAGNAYVTGATDSTNFPTTTGAYDTTYNGGGRDIFVLKFNANGNGLIYSTYVRGDGYEQGNAMALDAAGNAYVTGHTGSANFPTTTGAYDTTYNGGVHDIFVLKLNANGNGLIYSTYVGGGNRDLGFAMALDAAGNAYVTGTTSSTNFPTTTGAYDTTYNGGLYDIFVLKLNANGNGLIYSTYVGGGNDDYGNAMALDTAGNAYVTGKTGSQNFPTTTGAYDTTYNGGFYDIFVLKLNANGNGLIYSTYVGGRADDLGTAMALDAAGNACVTGYTGAANFPTTTGAYDTSFQGNIDVFVFKLGLASITDIGLRIKNGVTTARVACEPDTAVTSPLRIARNGRTYGIALVDPGTSTATKILVKTKTGVKAIAKLD